MNNVTLIGRLTKKPDLKESENVNEQNKKGKFALFDLAVNRENTKKEDVDFLHIIVFGKLAENCYKYLEKGAKAGVRGKIQTSKYVDSDGNNKYNTYILAERVEFLSLEKNDRNTNNEEFNFCNEIYNINQGEGE